jgi:GNAT superfamily N-acetyltransferase
MRALEIRSLQSGDEAQWRKLWTGYLQYYESTVPEEVYRSSFARMLSEDDNEFSGLIALVDGEPVGIVHFLFHRHGWKVENVCYLQDLFVAVPQRGSGVARALIEAVYERADVAGSPSVYWHTQHFNDAGRRLYDRVGKLSPFIVYNRSLDE